MTPIILASRSPRRKQLLEWAEVPFSILVQETDESFPADLSPADAAVHVAREKAKAVQLQVGHEPRILAADTMVVLGNRIIGKPRDRDDAISILQDLAGQNHRVITGVVIRQGKKK